MAARDTLLSIAYFRSRLVLNHVIKEATWRMGRVGNMEPAGKVFIQRRRSMDECFLAASGKIAPGLSVARSRSHRGHVDLNRYGHGARADTAVAAIYLCHRRPDRGGAFATSRQESGFLGRDYSVGHSFPHYARDFSICGHPCGLLFLSDYCAAGFAGQVAGG